MSNGGVWPGDDAASGVGVARRSGGFDACLRAIERMEEVIGEETDALRQNRAIDLSDFNRRKSHGLLELTRSIRGLEHNAEAREVIEPRLQPLRVKLAENGAVLRHHLEAVQGVAAILARTISDNESDGTYSVPRLAIGRE